jgi:hypothetical protein
LAPLTHFTLTFSLLKCIKYLFIFLILEIGDYLNNSIKIIMYVLTYNYVEDRIVA